MITLSAATYVIGLNFEHQVLLAGVLDRTAPMQLWRWITAHLVHADLEHLAWNLGALAVLGCVIERCSRAMLLAAIGSGMLAVCIWFFWLAGSDYYCGWSGALNALLPCALYVLSEPGRPITDSGRRQLAARAILALIALGALAKHAIELLSGAPLIGAGGWLPAPGAHLAGLLAGVVLVLITWNRQRRICVGRRGYGTASPLPFSGR